jgi:hypothetical protein
MKTDKSELQSQNAQNSIEDRLEGDSNVTTKREVQERKQKSQSVWVDEGMVIDESDEHC